MEQPPILVDRRALKMHRKRVTDPDALFLHADVVDEVQERLIEIKRSFSDVLIITPFAAMWQNSFPDAHVIEDGETYALDADSYDLVIHALALHWANDPVGQLIQCRQALRSDGLFLGVTFGGQTLLELRTALTEAETAIRDGLSPRIVPMGEIRDLGGLLQRAGFALPVADSAIRTVSYASALHLLRDLRSMGETNALADRHRQFAPRSLFSEMAYRYQTGFAGDDNRIPATFEMVYLTGWVPHETQQKPLRPGSAKTRLSEALGTDETSEFD
jgi:SAM-dependent methyltransferase